MKSMGLLDLPEDLLQRIEWFIILGENHDFDRAFWEGKGVN